MKVHSKLIKVFSILLVVAMLFAALPLNTVSADAATAGPGMIAAGDRLESLQNDDGGWDWPLDDGNPANASPANTIGPIAMGLAQAYIYTQDADYLAALEDAGDFLTSKSIFSGSDGFLAAQLDEIFGVTTYTTYVKTNFYDKLAAGTYVGSSGTYNTSSYITYIRNYRSGRSANLAAWDLGYALVGAAQCGVTGTELQYWIDGVKAEINELDDYTDTPDETMWYLSTGLAGALYGLAFVDEDIDPTTGYYAAATSIGDLFDELIALQNGSGGIVWHPDFMLANDQNENTQATAYAILALNEYDRSGYLTEILAAADYMLGIQLATGGWDNYPAVGTYEASGENNEVTAEALWGVHTAYPLDELWVCETGACGHTGAQFSTIQGAIDALAVGGTIHVAAGTYNENVTIDKSLSLLGEGRDVVTIVGQTAGDAGAVVISADDITIDGFSIQGFADGRKTVIVNSPTDNLVFKNNKVITAVNTLGANGWAGFETYWGTSQTNHVIDNNIFIANGTSQLVYYGPDASNIQFTNNTITGTMMTGGLVVGFNGLDGTQDISGNTFDIESTYALIEVDGDYDILDIFDANTWPDGYMPSQNKVIPESQVYYSTNDANRSLRYGYVNKVSADAGARTITLEFIPDTEDHVTSCFEYRTDGDTSQKISDTNYNNLIADGLYPFVCVQGNGASYPDYVVREFDVDEYIEVRFTFGSDKEGRFNWTKFELVGDLWVCPSGDCGHPGYGYNSIQDAIDAADNGATIHVMAGTYNDVGGNTVNKYGLNIILEDGVVIQNSSPCFAIEESFTRIEAESIGGATCIPTGGSNGIDVDANLTQVEIIGLEIDGTGQDTGDGINFAGVVTNAQVVDNFIHDMDGDGVYFDAQPVDQTGLSFYIQGNLFKHNAGVGVNNAGTTNVNAKYNSWSDYAGADGPDGNGATNADTEPYTHVDLYMVSTNPTVDNWPNQVFVDDSDPITPNDTITYQVKASVVNLTGASFDLNFPTSLVSAALVPGSVNSAFSPVLDTLPIVAIDSVSGVISFDGITGATPATVTPLTGEDIVLFEVTFTGVAPGAASLDFDEDTDEFSMAPVGGGPSNNIYADELVDATLDVITRPTLAADGLDTDFVAGLMSHEINLTTCNTTDGGDWTESVAAPIEPDTIAWVRISDITEDKIASLQFEWEGGWYEFDVQDDVDGDAVQQDGDDVIARYGNYDFGLEIPAFNICDVTSFRVTFVEPGTHQVTIEIYDMMDTSQDFIGGDDILLAYLGPEPITILGDFDVTGTVSMQGRTVRSGVPLTLTDVDGVPVYGPFTDDSGPELAFNVLFTGVNGSIYEITTDQPRYLNVTADLNKQFLVNGAYEIEPLELKGGNAFWGEDVGGTWVYNNVINIGDASLVGSNYNLSSFVADADVNFDGKVNIQDLALVGGNYGLTSTDAYADWLSASPWNGIYPTSAPTTLVAPESGVQEIYTAEEFAWILSQADMFPTGVNTVRLMKDIDLNNYPWTPSGGLASGSAVAGDIFDGNGHTIYNLRVIEEERAGLFVGDNGAEPIVQNLVIDGAYIEATPTVSNIESLAAVVNVGIDGGTSFSNVTVHNATIKATKYAAGISAYSSGLDLDGGYFTNCTVEDSVLEVQEMWNAGESKVEKPHVGGIVGLMNKGTFTGNSVTNLDITIHPVDGYAVATDRVGALIGTAQSGVSPKDPDFAPVNTISNVTYNGAAFTDLIGLDNR